MTKVDCLITVASWEPRFALGLERQLESARPSKILMYYYRTYALRTAAARARIGTVCDSSGIPLEIREIGFADRADAWKQLERDVATLPNHANVTVDITTMPREAMWSVFFWLEAHGARVSFTYHRPRAYGVGWLARDPDEPRFVFKLAGATELGRQTALLAVTGFDADRVLQAMSFYEPTKVVLALQSGTQFSNAQRNAEHHSAGAFSQKRVERVEVDAYSSDQGYESLRQVIETLEPHYNVVLSSFGPKLSAVALYRLQREFANCSLSYIRCKDYNLDYSTGIGETITGKLPLSPSQVSAIEC